jgi:capsular polysaccharide biosynthesis protein
MSDQPLGLRRFMQLIRRRKILVTAFTVLGLAAGLGYTAVKPPMLTSEVLVLLSPSIHDTSTQIVIAGSDPVLAGALGSVDPGMTPAALQSRVRVQSLASNVISINAEGDTADQAERIATAVADSYVHYLRSATNPGGPELARVLQRATAATGTSLTTRLLSTGGLGVVAGLLIGAITAFAISRSDRRLRERDEIAESIGVPILASIDVGHPSHTAGWRKLIEEYEPGAVDAWRLRKALRYLEVDPGWADADGSVFSLAVLSLSSDRKALALGPQLAVFAASLGIPTALVIGPQQDANITATLRAACATLPVPSGRLRNLKVTVSDDDGASGGPDASLEVVIAVVDGEVPQFAATVGTTATVLGVSAGVATADQLARVAARLAADGRQISGILVADPDPADHTNGRLPQLPQPAQRTPPRRITGPATETRR